LGLVAKGELRNGLKIWDGEQSHDSCQARDGQPLTVG
jgi:hypothetical protein